MCFRSNAGVLDNNHGFDNFARASMTVLAVFFQKNWSFLMMDCRCVGVEVGVEVRGRGGGGREGGKIWD